MSGAALHSEPGPGPRQPEPAASPPAWVMRRIRRLRSSTAQRLVIWLTVHVQEHGSAPTDPAELAAITGLPPSRIPAAWKAVEAAGKAERPEKRFFVPAGEPGRITVPWLERWREARRVIAAGAALGAESRWHKAAAKEVQRLVDEGEGDSLYAETLRDRVAERRARVAAARAETERLSGEFAARWRPRRRPESEPPKAGRVLERRLEQVLEELGWAGATKAERKAMLRVLRRLLGTAASLDARDPILATCRVRPAEVAWLTERQETAGLHYEDLVAALVAPALLRAPAAPPCPAREAGWRRGADLFGGWATGPPG